MARTARLKVQGEGPDGAYVGGLLASAIDEAHDQRDFSPCQAHEFDYLGNTSTGRDHVFHDENARPFRHLERASELHLPVLALAEDELDP
jgi:hypothetical protein